MSLCNSSSAVEEKPPTAPVVWETLTLLVIASLWTYEIQLILIDYFFIYRAFQISHYVTIACFSEKKLPYQVKVLSLRHELEGRDLLYTNRKTIFSNPDVLDS